MNPVQDDTQDIRRSWTPNAGNDANPRSTLLEAVLTADKGTNGSSRTQKPDASNGTSAKGDSSLVENRGKATASLSVNGDATKSVNGASRGTRNSLYNTHMRHGFEDEYNSDHILTQLAEVFFIYFEDKRHETGGNPRPGGVGKKFSEWRIRDRQRTVNAAIVLCLNTGVDPPDVLKPKPCAKTEAWIDGIAYNDPRKAVEQIGKQLQTQYEVLSTRTKYKLSLDPTVEEIKRFCMSLRRGARDERILFHYNGHGVPRPTASGEIWVFNRGYTQHIPVSVFDLQTWLGAPCIFTWDCHAAGNIVQNFNKFVEKRKYDEQANGRDPNLPPAALFDSCIQLAACRSDENLPMHPSLPADFFTCCLTTPIEISVRWFVLQSPLYLSKHSDGWTKIDFAHDEIPEGTGLKDDLSGYNLQVPGKITDRRTPLGELNWIFTAITDTIAWSTLDNQLFKRLFRQDLVVAALFRNFLLASRIMPVYNCHPVSVPELPPTLNHPMWAAWDLAVEQCLVQLPKLHEAEAGGKPYQYRHSDFFEQQLTAFEVWLKYKSSDLSKPPEQLPVLLQVLLSQIHRLRALILLSKYLDLGPNAVHMALSIGIFPYVLKLLQSPAPELKPVLVFIWARIMAVDYKNIQHELVKESGYTYFINILIPQEGFSINTINVYEHLAMCAFVTTLFCKEFKQAQRLCMNTDLFHACLKHTSEPDSPLLRQWACLCISQMWDDMAEAKQVAVKENILEYLSLLLKDPIAEVRTSCIVALTTFLCADSTEISRAMREREIGLASSLVLLTNDASPIVRRELVVFYSKFVKSYLNYFMVAAFTVMEEHVTRISNPTAVDEIRPASPAYGTIFITIWRLLLILSADPYAEVAEFADDVVDYVLLALHRSPLADDVASYETYLYKYSRYEKLKYRRSKSFSSETMQRQLSAALSNQRTDQDSPRAPQAPSTSDNNTIGNDGGVIKRSVSLANVLKRMTSFGVSGNSAVNEWSSEDDSKLTETPPRRDDNSPYSKFDGKVVRPSPVRYTPKDFEKEIALPLSSGFFEWSCEYFQEPQMCHSESDEPGSERYTERVWRKTRNETVLAETQIQKEMAVTGTWSVGSRALQNHSHPVKLTMAQFEPHLIVADDENNVSVWNWDSSERINKFNNLNTKSRITTTKLLNEDDQPLLLTGSSDGIVRIFRHYDTPSDVTLTCAWRVLMDMPLPSKNNPGLVAEWLQSRGALYVAGDVRVIRIWDAPRELCISDIPTGSPIPVTSLTSDQVSANIVVAGFADGGVRVYDRRVAGADSIVRTWKKHRANIVNIHMQRGGARELVSGSSDGKVNLWDLRMEHPVLEINSGNVLSSVELHEHAPVFATASGTEMALWSTSGDPVTLHEYNTSSFGITGKYNPVKNLAFHPHRMLLASARNNDSYISIYECKRSLSRTY